MQDASSLGSSMGGGETGRRRWADLLDEENGSPAPSPISSPTANTAKSPEGHASSGGARPQYQQQMEKQHQPRRKRQQQHQQQQRGSATPRTPIKGLPPGRFYAPAGGTAAAAAAPASPPPPAPPDSAKLPPKIARAAMPAAAAQQQKPLPVLLSAQPPVCQQIIACVANAPEPKFAPPAAPAPFPGQVGLPSPPIAAAGSYGCVTPLAAAAAGGAAGVLAARR